MIEDKTNNFDVEYALQSVVQPMGVSTYTEKERLANELRYALPTMNELKEIIERE